MKRQNSPHVPPWAGRKEREKGQGHRGFRSIGDIKEQKESLEIKKKKLRPGKKIEAIWWNARGKKGSLWVMWNILTVQDTLKAVKIWRSINIDLKDLFSCLCAVKHFYFVYLSGMNRIAFSLKNEWKCGMINDISKARCPLKTTQK